MIGQTFDYLFTAVRRFIRTGRKGLFGAGITAVMIINLLSPLSQAPVFALGAPTPLSPAYGTTTTVNNYPPLGIPELTWSPVSGATWYFLQIDNDPGFGSPVLQISTSNTAYTPLAAVLFPDGDWYWRVKVEYPAPGSTYSTEVKFIKQWATDDTKPVATFPIDGAELDFFTSPVFSWQPVTGAARYQLQISPSSDFGSGVLTYNTLTTSFQPQWKPANGQYYWRVIPFNAGEFEGKPSTTRSFSMKYGVQPTYSIEVPTLLEPLDKYDPGYVPPTFTPAFHWTAVPGAQYYRLEYTTDPTCNFGVAGYTWSYDTYNTSFTPLSAFPNDQNYCWHVRAQSGTSVSDWSDTWEFQKQWYIQPKLLTPTNNYQHTKIPYFSWKPVPAAGYYKIEICNVNSFPCMSQGFTDYTVNPYFTKAYWLWSLSTIWYWRVTPYHENDNTAGYPSTTFSYIDNYESLEPIQIYPQYYYLPNNYPTPYEDAAMNPYEDRTVSLPIFMWQRIITTLGQEAGPAYRIQVDDNPLFNSINWTFDTENLNATPSSTSPFTPLSNLEYSWRVCTLSAISGTCISDWSQVWKTHIDTSLVLTSTESITLLRPPNANEFMETTPVFEWWPLEGATSYEIQISQDPTFATYADSAAVTYPAYSPQYALANRYLEKFNYGTYYWRVRGMNGATPVGSWSAPWRFQLAAQTQWQPSRSIGSHGTDQYQIANDLDDISDNTYEVTKLYAAQDKDYWYFGFNFSNGSDMAYVLYLDLDAVDNSGATSDAQNYNVTTIGAHHPEYAIYFFKRSNTFSTDQIAVFEWGGSDWEDDPQLLSAIGGGVSVSANSYIEVRIPNTAIGMGDETGSAALSLFSVNETSNAVQDSTPSSTSTANLDRFTSLSEHVNLRTPPTALGGDPSTFPSVPAFYFDYPLGGAWEGFRHMISLDPGFSNWIRDYTLYAGNFPYHSPGAYTEFTRVQDLNGDNTYYWRVRPQYDWSGGETGGSWSQGFSFERNGFIPQNLNVSTTFATPTFSWDMVEGAKYYEIHVDGDPNFGSLDAQATTAQTSYTPLNPLANGTYYWRVRIIRETTSANDWSTSQSFTLNLPAPTGLTPDDPTGSDPVQYAPTLCWNKLVSYHNGVAVLAAWRYRVQVSISPTFSPEYDFSDTESNCWTPTRGYADGKYYWRVAMYDGFGHMSDYSPAASFTKQYPTTTLISPVNGSTSGTTPTFVWTPVNGALRYKLEVSLDPLYSTIYESIETNNTRFTSVLTYPRNATYYWRVAIVDREGIYGPPTGASLFIGASNKVYLPIIRR